MQGALATPPADPAAWTEAHTRILKSDEYSRVGLLNLQEQLCYLKFYRAKSMAQQLLFRLGRGRAIGAFDTALELGAQGVPVPEPRACVLVPGGVMLLTEGMPGAVDLKALWLQQPDATQAGQLMIAAGAVVGNLHRAGFAHGDCKWSNLLWSDDRIFLGDLEAVSHAAPGSRRQARDIARFTVNAEDLGVEAALYEQFIGAYLASAGGCRDTLLTQVRPCLDELRSRHLQKYGERGARLL